VCSSAPRLYEVSGGFGTLLAITQDSDDPAWDHRSLQLLIEEVGPRLAGCPEQCHSCGNTPAIALRLASRPPLRPAGDGPQAGETTLRQEDHDFLKTRNVLRMDSLHWQQSRGRIKRDVSATGMMCIIIDA
jgi:hypothetical protein